MSQANVEIVRSGLRHFQTTGELPWHLMTQDFVWDMSRFGGWLERPVYEGTAGARRFIDDWAALGRTGRSRLSPFTMQVTVSLWSFVSEGARRRPACPARW